MPKLKSNVLDVTEESSTSNESISSKIGSKELLNKFIEEETRLVKGRFRNHEVPGGSLPLFIKKYPNVPPFQQVLEDGKTYEVPLYVARHLNGTDATATKTNKKINTCAYPTHGFKSVGGEIPRGVDAGNTVVPIIGPIKWTRRYSFESMEFDSE